MPLNSKRTLFWHMEEYSSSRYGNGVVDYRFVIDLRNSIGTGSIIFSKHAYCSGGSIIISPDPILERNTISLCPLMMCTQTCLFDIL